MMMLLLVIFIIILGLVILVAKYGDDAYKHNESGHKTTSFRHYPGYILSTDVKDGKYDNRNNLTVNQQEAVRLIKMLLDVYTPLIPYQVRITNKKPKTRMGYYFCNSQRILIHKGWLCISTSQEIAIHELSHHIHLTEQGGGCKGQRVHGKEFWSIYDSLRLTAIRKGYKL